MDSETRPKLGMVFEATITAPVINGAGEVNFLQTVVEQSDRYEDAVNPQNQEISSHDVVMLDTEFPYGEPHRDPDDDVHRWSIGAGDTLGPSSTNALTTSDSPKQPLYLNDGYGTKNEDGSENVKRYTKYEAADEFTMHVMYKPEGEDSIWVPLRGYGWDWTATAEWKLNPLDNKMKWMFTKNHTCYSTSDFVVTAPLLLEWEGNVTAITALEIKFAQEADRQFF